jgi:hypothetical protein
MTPCSFISRCNNFSVTWRGKQQGPPNIWYLTRYTASHPRRQNLNIRRSKISVFLIIHNAILSQFNPVHFFITCFFKVNFVITLQLHVCQVLVPSSFPPNLCNISYFLDMLRSPTVWFPSWDLHSGVCAEYKSSDSSVKCVLPPANQCTTWLYTILLLLLISFMHGVYTYIAETNHVSRQYSVAAIL